MSKSKTKQKKKSKSKDGLAFSGVCTALVTPFKNQKVDYKSLIRLIEHQLENGVEGFVINGTTAESPTLERQEVEKIFKTAKKIVGNKVPLILGIGSNSTSETLQRSMWANKWGADAALVVVPYYNKPPQRGMVDHFRAVAKASRVPIILYNVPGRTVVSMKPETVLELSKEKNIVGIKEASGDLTVLDQIRKAAPKSFLLSSGDDATAVEFCLKGGAGVISVVSHVIPREMVDIIVRARKNDPKSLEDYRKFAALNKLMGIESNPIPVKMALHLMGIIDSPELRLPLVTLGDGDTRLLAKELESLGVLK
jgi:4-hydroxy-tetrahydrodipicolinate synthase